MIREQASVSRLFHVVPWPLTTTAPLRKRATVALARRIGVVLHRMWRDGTEFRFTREEAMAAMTPRAA